jgi:dTDP-4-dehydrorhamnose reductase
MTHFQRALVLGGKTGLVGQALMEALHGNGWETRATDRSSIDYTSPDAGEQLEALVEEFAPACIFNAVGYTAVDAAEDHPEEADLLNRALPAMVGRAAKRFSCQLVHYSTDFVFNGRKKTPYTTDDPTEPLSVYGRTKLAGEEALLALELPECIIIRTAWLFGPGKDNFVSKMLRVCKERNSVNVVHDQIGSPTYTPDLALYSLKLVEAKARGIFHVVNSGVASWCELASEAARLVQSECVVTPIPSSAYPTKAARPAYSVLDTASLERATGLSPRPWIQALTEYMYREFPAE